RISTNIAGAELGEYKNIKTSNIQQKPQQAPCKSGCTPKQIAEYDAWRWHKVIERRMPKGQGFVECKSGSGCSTYKITIAWYERQLTEDKGSSYYTDKTKQCKD